MEKLSKLRVAISGVLDKFVSIFALLVCAASLAIARQLSKNAPFSRPDTIDLS